MIEVDQAETLQRFEEVLRRRSERLRGVSERSLGEDVVEQIAVLEVGAEQLGIPVSCLRELVACPPIARLPSLPAWIAGIVQIRGELLSAVDLASWLGIEAEREPGQLAVVEGPQGPVGLLAHRVLGFRELSEADLAHEYSGAGGVSERLVSGMTADLVAILDVEQLVADDDLVVESS